MKLFLLEDQQGFPRSKVSRHCTVVKLADINARGGKSTFFPVNIYPWHCFFIYGIDILRCLEVKKKFFGPHICPYQLPYPLIPPSTVVVLYTGGFWVYHCKCNNALLIIQISNIWHSHTYFLLITSSRCFIRQIKWQKLNVRMTPQTLPLCIREDLKKIMSFSTTYNGGKN